MNKFRFQRFLSGVLALVMMTSTLTMVNVVSVSAADTTPAPTSFYKDTDKSFFLGAEQFTTKAGKNPLAITMETPAANAGFTVTDKTPGDVTLQAFGTRLPAEKLTNNSKYDFTGKQELYYEGISSRTLSFTPTVIGTLTVYVYADSNAGNVLFNKVSVGQISTNTIDDVGKEIDPKDGAVAITFEKKMTLLGIEFTPKSASADKIAWVLDKSDADGTLKAAGLDPDKIALGDPTAVVDSNTLVYNGYDWIVNPNYVHLTSGTDKGVSSETNEGTKTITVKPVKEMFIKCVGIDGGNFKVNNATINKVPAAKILRLRCNIHTNTFHNISISADGTVDGYYEESAEGTLEKKELTEGKIWLPTDNYKMQMAGGTLTLKTNDGDASFEDNVLDITETTQNVAIDFTETEWQDVAGATEIIDVTKDLYTSVNDGLIFDGDIIGDGYFQVMNNTDYTGGMTLVMSDDVDEENNSNVDSLEIKVADEDGGLRFKTGAGIPENLHVKVFCSSSTDEEHDSKIALRVKDSLEAPSAQQVPGSEQTVSNADGKKWVDLGAVEGGKVYGIYNSGEEGSYDNVRVSAVQFVAGEPVPTGAYKATLNGEDDPISSGLTFDVNSIIDKARYFKVTGTDSKKLTTDSKTVTFDANDGKHTIKTRIKTNAKGESNSIVFQTAADSTGNGEIHVWAASASNTESDNRVLALKPEGGEANVSETKLSTNSSSPNKTVFTVEAGKTYSLYVSNGGGGNISFIGSTAELVPFPVATHDVTFKGTGAADAEVTINVKKGEESKGTIVANQGVAFEQKIEALEEGDYTLTSDTPGYVVKPATFKVGADTTEVADITITKDESVKVVFDVAASVSAKEEEEGVKAADADAVIEIWQLDASGSPIDSTKKSIKNMNSEAEFANVAPGTRFKFKSTSRNTYKWVARRAGVLDQEGESDYSFKFKEDIGILSGSSGNTRYFVYTVPSNAQAGTEYGVQFTAAEKISSVDIKRNKNSYGNKDLKPLEFGQYGFGGNKAAGCGNDARDFTSYSFEYAGLSDYNSGYSSDVYNTVLEKVGNDTSSVGKNTNEYGILNGSSEGKKTYIRFKIADDVQNTADPGAGVNVVIDKTGNIALYEVNPDSDYQHTGEAIKDSSGTTGSGKSTYPVAAGKTYEIVASGTTGTVYVKSIRLLNPNNIFSSLNTGLEKEEEAQGIGTYDKVDQAIKDVLENASADKVPTAEDTVFRIIGEIKFEKNNATSIDAVRTALNEIKAVGYDVYDGTEYENALTNIGESSSKKFNESLRNVYNEKAPTKLDTIAFTDTANTAVDYDQTKTNVNKGDTDPANSKGSVFVQTFIATNRSLVLVPWVTYSDYNPGDASNRIYSSVNISANKTDKTQDNNIYIDIE